MNPFSWFFGPPSQDQFADMVMKVYRRAGDTSEKHYDKAEFRLTDAGGGEVNLGNLYHEYCNAARSELMALLRRTIQGFVASRDELPDSFDIARPNLRPKIWTRAAFTQLELRKRLEGHKSIDVPHYLLGSHLISTVVYDLPTAMRTLSADDFEKWGVSYYEAMEAACQNLQETSIAYSRIGDNFHSAISGDSYDSSRILLKDLISTWEVIGETVAMVPQRDALYVTGSDDETGLRIMVELTEATLRDEPRPLCPIPLGLVDGEWEDWMLPPTHPMYQQFKNLETNYVGELYADQKKLLEALYEQTGEPVFLATYTGMKADSGEVLSYCCWARGITSSLPRT